MSKQSPAAALYTWVQTAPTEEVNAFLSDIAKMVTQNAELKEELAAVRGQVSKEYVNKNTARPSDDDADLAALTNVVRAAALRAGAGGYEANVAIAKEDVKATSPFEAFAASLDDLPETRSGKTN